MGRGCRVLGLVLALGAACDDSPSAEGACRSFVASYCAKAASCEETTDRRKVELDCTFYFEVNAPCEMQLGSSTSLEVCQRQIAATDCSTSQPGYWPAIPASCRGLAQ